MPKYDYQCPQCGVFEKWKAFEDAALSECPDCGSPVRKLFCVPEIHLPGKELLEELDAAAEYDARHPMKRAPS